LIDTIILAGGMSKRFKTNKLATLYNGKPLICNVIETFLEFSENVTLVTGHYDLQYLSNFITNEKIRIVHNSEYQKGMFTSVQTGVGITKNDFFLIPGDYPLVKPQTIQKIIDSLGAIRVPIYKGRKGHPIFISKELINPLLKEPSDSNLKIFRDRHIVNYIDVDDEGILLDVDTLNDLNQLRERNE
jgi:molybdenum cofactor cytidylyltransferase